MQLDDLKSNLTIGGYITNPNGKRNGNVLNIPALRSNLDGRYEKLDKSKLDIMVYSDKDNIYIHSFIPSEKYDIRYDVVFKIPNVPDTRITKSEFKVYSNSPAFAFSYAYVFNSQGLLIPELSKKYGKDILHKAPIQRNGYNLISLDKSLYFAITSILDRYTTTNELISDAKSFKKSVFSDIKDIDEKINEYNKVKTKEKKETEKAKKKDMNVRERIATTVSDISTTTKSKITGKSKIGGKTKNKWEEKDNW